MAIPRQKFREAVFLALFGLAGGGTLELLPFILMEELKMTKKNAMQALEIAQNVLEQQEAFDDKIRLASTAYEFERIPHVEKNILRLGLFEMGSLPPAIAISEAIRLSRKFSTPESASFINAILDNVLKHGKG